MSTETLENEALKPKGRIRKRILVVVFVAYLVAFFDRSNISVLVADKNFTDAFGITNDASAQGLITTAFLVFYGLTCFFAGPLVLKLGAKKALTIGTIVWAGVMLLMGAISSFALLIACRAFLGLGETVLGPAVSKLIQTWFPIQERSKANGVWFIGVLLANVFSMPVITGLVSVITWRGSFYVLGLVGLIPTILTVILVYDKITKHPKITAEEIAYINGGQTEEKNTGKAKTDFQFLKNSSFWYVVTLYSLFNACSWGLIAWIPTYLKATLGFSWAQMGGLAALPYLCGAILVLTLTRVMDRYNRRAIFAMSTLLCFTICATLMTIIDNKAACVALLCVASAVLVVANPSVFTMLQNITKPDQVAAAAGFLNGVGYIFAALVPFAMGVLYNSTGTLITGFYFMIVLGALAVISSIPLVRRNL